MTTILLIPHVDAGDREAWVGDHDVRPLSELGQQQAEALADVLADRSVRALYASPALRARQTLEPLARRMGLEIMIDLGLSEHHAGEGEKALARRAWRTLRAIADDVEIGTAAAASHGDLIPAVIKRLEKKHGLGKIPEITRRGQWYEIDVEGDAVSVSLNEGPDGFPG